MRNSFRHLGCLLRRAVEVDAFIPPKHPQRDLLVSMGDRPLDRNIWEAFYHRLGVLVLGMILETDVAQKRVLDMSRPWKGRMTTHAGALVVTSYDKVI